MVKAALVDDLFREGADLLRSLDKAGFPVVAAFWLFDSDTTTWKYFIATPRMDTEGPLQVYRELQKYAAESRGIALQDIAVVSPHDQLVEALRTADPTPAKEIVGRRITGNSINNIFIEDAYIYRLAPKSIEAEPGIRLGIADMAVLRAIGDLAQKYNRKQVAVSDLAERLASQGIDAETCSRSLDFLAENHIIDGRKYPQIGWAAVSLTLNGMELYATHFIENYGSIQQAVAHYLAENQRTRATQVAAAVKQSLFLVGHIIEFWKAQGLITATQVVGGDWVIADVSETLRRMAAEE